MKSLKRIASLAAALLMALALVSCAGSRVEGGPALEHNVARFYSPGERVSRFAIDGGLVPGEAKGLAYMDTSARGDTSLAWVDTALYFVSAAGVDKLGTGIAVAEISFDGRKALFLEGNELKLYSVDTRGTTVIDSGISSIVQFAFSPNSESIAFTAEYEDEPEDSRVKLYKGGALTELFEGRNAAVMAVSDEADVIWYFEFGANEFCVEKNGERIVVSEKCGADAKYNFTNDLSEVAFNTSDGMNRLWRLASRSETELGDGFDFTLKTDVFSISTVTLFTYINDVSSFTNGMWQKRLRTEDGYIYSVGLIDKAGEIEWLAENADEIACAPDFSRVAWVKGGQLYSTDPAGKNTQLASGAGGIGFADDPNELWFMSGSVLYLVKGTGRPERIDSGVKQFETIGGACVYLKDDGSLFCAENGKTEELMGGFAKMEKRAGQLLAYADPAGEGDQTVYKAYVTVDGRSFTLIGEGIRP